MVTVIIIIFVIFTILVTIIRITSWTTKLDKHSREEHMSSISFDTANYSKLGHHGQQGMLANTKDPNKMLPDTLGPRARRPNLLTDTSAAEKKGIL